MSNKNLDLWNAVVTTDPAYTKQFNRGGGFKGTATNFVYNCRKATEHFGMCGIGWGAKVLDEKYVPGAVHVKQPRDENGDPTGPAQSVQEITHVIRIEFWYEFDGKRGSIESYGQTTYVGVNKNGAFTDEEAPKKSLTDAMSKAMSWLGFSADIHLGLYDDNKYVNDLKRESTGKTAIVEPPSESPPTQRVDVVAWKAGIEEASDALSWQMTKEQCFKNCTELADAESWAILKDVLAKKAKALKLTKEQVNGK